MQNLNWKIQYLRSNNCYHVLSVIILNFKCRKNKNTSTLIEKNNKQSSYFLNTMFNSLKQKRKIILIFLPFDKIKCPSIFFSKQLVESEEKLPKTFLLLFPLYLSLSHSLFLCLCCCCSATLNGCEMCLIFYLPSEGEDCSLRNVLYKHEWMFCRKISPVYRNEKLMVLVLKWFHEFMSFLLNYN